MIEPRFHITPEPLDFHRLVAVTGADARGAPRSGFRITGVAALDWAGPFELAVVADPRDADALASSRAGACLMAPAFAERTPAGALALVTDEPGRAFARAAAALFPSAARPQPLFGPGVAAGAVVHPEARLEPDVSVDPGAVIGPRAEIGRGALIGANAVIGADVRIGRSSAIGHGATVFCALIGDRVAIGAGARIGDEARAGADGPALGRVIVQDDVDIGPNAAIARGAIGDTVIGEASRIGALVSVGPGAWIGRCCVIFAAADVAGRATLPDCSTLGRGGGPTRPDGAPKDH